MIQNSPSKKGCFYFLVQSVSINGMWIIILFILGLCFGSFVNALVWRLHKKRNFVSERSECVHCHHVLAWNDLIPVLSWLTLRGRCRYCKKKIDDSPVTEMGVALVFVLSYVLWPFGFATVGLILFTLWLVSVVLLAALFLYDLKWMLLPDKLNFPLIGIGAVWAIIFHAFFVQNSLGVGLLESALGVASVAGLYGFLYMLSKGAWVGFGDVKLGIFMGLILGWQGGLLAVLLANTIAFLFIFPGLLTNKISRTSKIPFGPFLILATVISLLLGGYIIKWYVDVAFML